MEEFDRSPNLKWSFGLRVFLGPLRWSAGSGHLARVAWRQSSNFEADQHCSKSVYECSGPYITVTDSLVWVLRPRYSVSTAIWLYVLEQPGQYPATSGITDRFI